MPATNVELSKNELELVMNSEFILTKVSIIEKVYNLFGWLSEDYKTILNSVDNVLPEAVIQSSPKIYKGENYLNLPYVMMDHPRLFNKTETFAIRSFFWWGNYFSLTLQLGGKLLEQYRAELMQNLTSNNNEHYFVCVNNSQWEHHFEATNYKPIQAIDITELINKPFIKIAVKLPLNKWNEAELFFKENYSAFMQLLKK